MKQTFVTIHQEEHKAIVKLKHFKVLFWSKTQNFICSPNQHLVVLPIRGVEMVLLFWNGLGWHTWCAASSHFRATSHFRGLSLSPSTSATEGKWVAEMGQWAGWGRDHECSGAGRDWKLVATALPVYLPPVQLWHALWLFYSDLCHPRC